MSYFAYITSLHRLIIGIQFRLPPLSMAQGHMDMQLALTPPLAMLCTLCGISKNLDDFEDRQRVCRECRVELERLRRRMCGRGLAKEFKVLRFYEHNGVLRKLMLAVCTLPFAEMKAFDFDAWLLANAPEWMLLDMVPLLNRAAGKASGKGMKGMKGMDGIGGKGGKGMGGKGMHCMRTGGERDDATSSPASVPSFVEERTVSTRVSINDEGRVEMSHDLRVTRRRLV